MTPEEIKAKASELAAFYTAKANGKTLQFLTDVWADYEHDAGPSIGSDLSRWRVKPEPRTFWVLLNQDGEVMDATRNEERADRWRKGGYAAVETKEVLP